MLYYCITCTDYLINFPMFGILKLISLCSLYINADTIDSCTPETYTKKYLPRDLTGYVSSTKYSTLHYDEGNIVFVVSLMILIHTCIIKNLTECFASRHYKNYTLFNPTNRIFNFNYFQYKVSQEHDLLILQTDKQSDDKPI